MKFQVYNKIDCVSLEEVDRIARMDHSVVIRYTDFEMTIKMYFARGSRIQIFDVTMKVMKIRLEFFSYPLVLLVF